MSKKMIWVLLIVMTWPILYAQLLGIEPDLYHTVFMLALMACVARLPRGLSHGLFALLIVVAAAYYPTLVRFGPPSIGIVAAAANSNLRESYEYMQGMSLTTALVPLLFVVVSVAFFQLARASMRPQKWVLVTVVLVLLLPVLTRYDKDYNQWVLAYKNGYFSVRAYFHEQKKLREMAAMPSSWHVNGRQPRYQNYVLILGESTRKDHLSTYGFAMKTTPFLDAQKGLFFTNMVAPAANTYFSVPRLLSLVQKGQLQTNNNVLSLAKAAGFDTYWFSNQGFVGAADTEVSAFALQADQHYFTKKGDWSFENVDDFDLLPKLKAALSQPSTKPKFIVLHVMGTHYQFCDRLFPEDQRLSDLNPELSCYVSGVLKTDEFIKRTHQALQKQGQSFSLNYISDHGLSYTGQDAASYGLIHHDGYKENYEVPFLFLSSDDEDRRMNHAQKSGFQYVNAFAEWLGIDVEELNHLPSFFTDEDDDVLLYTREGTLRFDDLPRDVKPQR